MITELTPIVVRQREALAKISRLLDLADGRELADLTDEEQTAIGECWKKWREAEKEYRALMEKTAAQPDEFLKTLAPLTDPKQC